MAADASAIEILAFGCATVGAYGKDSAGSNEKGGLAAALLESCLS